MIPLTALLDGCTFFVAADQIESVCRVTNVCNVVTMKSGRQYEIQEAPQVVAQRVQDELLLMANGGPR